MESLTVRPARRMDLPALLEMFTELAEYENLTDELIASEDSLAQALFSQTPLAYGLIAAKGSQAIGYAVFYRTFSTFLAAPGIWLEDLYVRPDHRTLGVGRAPLAAVAARAVTEGCGRLEWSALDWNEPALRFYRGLDATSMGNWVPHRLTGENLKRIAQEAR